jgi:hypothetical protein
MTLDYEAFGHIVGAIRKEREYQDRKYGQLSQHPHDVGAWLTIMRCELREAEEAWTKGNSDDAALCEVLQVVAVGVACMEQHKVVSRNELSHPSLT